MPLAFQCRFCFPAVKPGWIINEFEHIRRHAQIMQDLPRDSAHGRQHHQALLDHCRYIVEQPGVETHAHLRRMRGLRKYIEHFADTFGLGIRQVETLSVLLRLVCDVIHRLHHEIDRDDIEPPSFESDRGHPGRHRLAHFLDQFEKIVRAVNLVDFDPVSELPTTMPGR